MGDLALHLAVVVLPAPPEDAEDPGCQAGCSQLVFICCILLSLAAQMGSHPWQGVQAFFHGAVELAGKVPSAAWLDPGSGCAEYNKFTGGFLTKECFCCLQHLLPSRPWVCAQQEGSKLFFKKLGTFFSSLTGSIKTAVPLLLY